MDVRPWETTRDKRNERGVDGQVQVDAAFGFPFLYSELNTGEYHSTPIQMQVLVRHCICLTRVCHQA